MKILSVFSHKGGVGKSTIAFNLGYLLSLEKKVLLIDTDPQNSISGSICENIYHGLSNIIKDEEYHKLNEYIHYYNDLHILAVGEFAIKKPNLYRELLKDHTVFSNKLKKYLVDYDFVIFDTSAGLNSETINASYISDEILVVVEANAASFNSIISLEYALGFLHKTLHKKIYTIINKIHISEIGVDFEKAFRYVLEEKFLESIPFDNNVHFANAVCKSVYEYDKDSVFIEFLERIKNHIK